MHSDIIYIGAEDDNLDLFEGQYPIPNGISYNSYLINDTTPAVIDTVDTRRCTDWLTSLRAALTRTGHQAPGYIIIQHVEPDHSGSLHALLHLYPHTRVVCTARARQMLQNYFEDIDFTPRTITVTDGDTLTLGNTTLTFITAPMVHWPEVMMTLDTTHHTLFSADAFGTFAMSTSTQPWAPEARRYYTNIVGRFGTSVQAIMKKLQPLRFDTILPLHGPALHGDLAPYWQLYDRWSQYQPETQGILIAYASIYGGTAQAARQLAAILRSKFDGEVQLLDLSRHHISYAIAEAFRLSHIVLASVTYDGDLFPAMHDFLHHIQRKNLRNRTIGLIENGSWAPAAARLMTAALATTSDMTILTPTVTLHSRLHQSDLPTLQALADNLLATMK